ncbi:gluconate 2-dehydrogenase subunit 3 family protein [Thalassotalea fonticola]|uniref:Gluconate 2-dehydrogenase subunit 3 family protein n=1 Tax=Thalassotalea fonticola TaxID=3065649 RepID=A0ABZ0GJW7_9GAMM|nr:gluconate 2-dehydrogenase subunit 3 family protein [Colwelliaceae bacterium S1-1]
MSRRRFLKQAAIVLGASISTSVTAAVLKGASNKVTSNMSKLSSQQLSALTLLSERIIPKTDTPGAIDAGVPDFINIIVSQWYNDEERLAFFSGLKAMDSFCIKQCNCPLVQASPVQLDSVLTEFEMQAVKHEKALHETTTHEKTSPEQTSKPIFTTLRELVVVGFFTSKVGATQALVHNHMAGKFVGDYPLSKVGKAWAPFY